MCIYACDRVERRVRWASAIASPAHLGDAIAEATESLVKALAPGEIDLAFVFVSNHHLPHIETLPELLGSALPKAVYVGCTAAGAIGEGREIEEAPAVAILAGQLPETTTRVLHFGAEPASWENPVPVGTSEPRHLVVIADPGSCDSARLIGRLERWYGEHGTIVGGLASGGSGPGTTALLAGDSVVRSGAVVLELAGNIEIDTIVAQGCRPIGEPMFVTEAHRNIISQIDGIPALAALERLHRDLPPDDRVLAMRGLQVGIAMEPSTDVYEAGDFLIRDLLGADVHAKVIGINYEPKAAQVIQFHVRDADTANEELRELLARHQYASPLGVLLFSCVGRGYRFFGTSDHDSAAFAEQFGNVPIAGFFGNGEIGPVRGKTFIHGYTSAFALLRQARPR